MDSRSADLTGEDVRRATFRRPPFGRRGYDEDEVDGFLRLVADSLDGSGAAVTGQQVHDVIFRKPAIGKRGYEEMQVDAFLERIERQLGR